MLLVNHNILYVLIRVLVRHPLIAIIILVVVICWRVVLEPLHAGCPYSNRATTVRVVVLEGLWVGCDLLLLHLLGLPHGLQLLDLL